MNQRTQPNIGDGPDTEHDTGNNDGGEDHHKHEAGTAARMMASLHADILTGQWQTGLIASDSLMLRTMVLEYALNFLHLGNDGNVCLANNVLALLRGGLPITYVNRKHFDIYNDSAQRIGQFNICEMYANGYPELKVKANFGSAMANTTKTFTIDQRDFFTSAPWALFPYQLNDITKRCHIHSPYSETLGTSNMVNSFEVTLVVTSAGATFTTENGIGINFSA